MDEVYLKLPVKLFKRKIGFRFSMLAWFKLCDVYDIDLAKMGELKPDEMLQGIIYGSAVAWYFEHHKKLPNWLTMAMAGKWMNEMSVEQAKRFSDVMVKSQPVQKYTKQEGEKKN